MDIRVLDRRSSYCGVDVEPDWWVEGHVHRFWDGNRRDDLDLDLGAVHCRLGLQAGGRPRDQVSTAG